MSKRAVSLIEVLVAAILLALVLAGMSSVFITGRRSLLHSRSRSAGGELGRYFLDPLQADVNQATWGSNCLTAGTGCPGALQVPPITYTPAYSTADVSAWVGNSHLKKVKVTITWNEPPPTP
ncbi:MAG TPA: hypothetical protein VMD52_03030 [Patescibacteria group bacterium]|nr:hypothetical protein [Patescibacteria group bacterium]